MLKPRHFPRWIVGPPHDPVDPGTRRRLLLTAVLASTGLGANGLSSACYGPEKAFLALGSHPELGPVLAVATAVTVLILALAYTQIIELFPSGGGNYKVVSQLLGPGIGLIAGSALLVDYVLTIVVSLVSGTDGLFSVLPASAQTHKQAVEIGLLMLLVALNLRGVSDAIRFLLPVVLAFLMSHGFLIVYGIASSANSVPAAVTHTVTGAHGLSQQIGWPLVAALLLRAYSLGGSSFTGIEAIANNVNLLARPRYRTGRTTLLSVALMLGFIAGGILLLFTLWGVRPVYGQTLNAVAFGTVHVAAGRTGTGRSDPVCGRQFHPDLCAVAAGQYGDGLVAAASVLQSVEPIGTAERCRVRRWLRARHPDSHPRRTGCAGCALQHQRVPEPGARKGRSVPLLVDAQN
jgi:amino acid transporter